MKEKDREKKLKKRILRYLTRFVVTLFVSVILLAGGIYSVMFMLVNGPSKTASDLFVMSVKETSAIGFLANWFFTDDEIKDIIDRNSIKNTNEVTDPNLVKVEDKDTNTTGDEPKKEQEPIEVIDIKGATYRGKLMIIKDPKRVFVGTCPTFSMAQGEVVSDMAKRYKAVAGVNGGEFVDGENTYTAMPVGLVIVDGTIKNGDLGTTYHVTGFTKDNILVVGNMTGKEALEKNIKYCVSINNSIGPFLIINGTPMDVSGVGGGLNPRTAIGQRADGSILLLAVDGRQANSLGASFADLVYIMQEHGAVNASTMDGGTSTQMYYNGEVINKPYSPTGPRNCPTAFLVGGE